MKIFASAAAALFLASASSVQAAGHTCTHGMLFVSDAESTMVRAMDLNGETPFTVIASIDLTDIPMPEIELMTTSTTGQVAVVYRGQKDEQYMDGKLLWIDAGVTVGSDGVIVEPTSLSLIDNAAFDCARAIHFVPHDGKIAIFCDGMLNNVTQVNSTVWVIDESLFGSSESAIIYTTTIQGSHHGVAVPIDDNHLLYSLATPARAGGDYEETSLPATFQVVDYEGTILHSIADTNNTDMSCSGFHGSYAIDGNFLLACDDEHGGILKVDYEPTAGTYTSRALSYPASYAGHRTGSFAEHHLSPLVVGSFASGDFSKSYLVAFALDDEALSDDMVLSLDSDPCGYKWEGSEGQMMLIMMPGHLLVYTVSPTWEMVANITMIEGMQTCDGAMFVEGHGMAFAFDVAGQALYSVELGHVSHGEFEVKKTDLGFTPFAAIVAGVPPGSACKVSAEMEDHSGHDHEEEEPAEMGESEKTEAPEAPAAATAASGSSSNAAKVFVVSAMAVVAGLFL